MIVGSFIVGVSLGIRGVEDVGISGHKVRPVLELLDQGGVGDERAAKGDQIGGLLS